jgi:hypothetical protein
VGKTTGRGKESSSSASWVACAKPAFSTHVPIGLAGPEGVVSC